MHLIIGGAWQGKRKYAMQQFGLAEEEIYNCTADGVLDLNKRCFDHYEQHLRFCSDNETEPYLGFAADSVVICQDIFCGVVSVDPRERAWRELSGQTVTALAAKADSVTRIFCGLPMKLK